MVAATDAQPPMPPPVPWIDVHLHLIGGRERSPDFAGAVEAAIREMDRFGIAMAIVRAIAAGSPTWAAAAR